MVTHKGFGEFVLSACMMFFALTLLGCIVAAVPLIIHATRGSSTSTATVLVNRNAATVYAEAVKAVKERGYTEITKQMTQSTFSKERERGRMGLCK